MQFDVFSRRWKRFRRNCFIWELLERRHQWSLGSLATGIEPSDRDVFHLRFLPAYSLGGAHGARWKIKDNKKVSQRLSRSPLDIL